MSNGGNERSSACDELFDEGALGAGFGRRRFLVIGGATAAAAAVIAACGEDSGHAGIARVGNAPSTTALPASVVNDVVLLRTASSLEHTIIGMYEQVLGMAELVDSPTRQYFTEFRDRHAEHAETFERLTVASGGAAWTCSNPRLDTVVVTPIMRAIVGGPATDTAAESVPSDDPPRDVKSFAHGMESMAASTYQGLVGTLSDPGLRQESARVGVEVARHAALLAMLITGTPEGYVSPEGLEEATGITTTTAAPSTTQDIAAAPTLEGQTAAPPSTPIPAVYAISGQYGSLGATQIVVGSPDPETGNRVTLNLETPSLNTFVYEYMIDCDA